MKTHDATKLHRQVALKPVPYFPLYAANIIADRSYRLMSLVERGLLLSLYLECWVNTNAPRNSANLAKILGIQDKEVESGLTNNVLHYFKETNNQLHSLELDEYRAGFLAKREAQSLGGIEGALRKATKAEAKAKALAIKGEASIEQQKQSQGLPKGVPEGSLNSIKSTSINSNSLKSNALVVKEVSVDEEDPFIKACFSSDVSSEYLHQSKGR
ncbi:hypothetical protein ICN49_02410 [Polynucleobacter sp. MWH-Mekk-B1]|uniref:hypothetical protein n=1 Tax=Polynucleobacter finlandensis TaxID=1855894 RepID=UPI001C0AA04C|nr:hypothetical protein [Polynucleobacter finlandensis]MBU3543765.1 hypothetical protein [Polynucleobacter finlandensis]